MKMKPSRNLIKSFCIILFVLFYFSCNSELIILFNDGNMSSGSGSGTGIPVEMSWVTDQQNVTAPAGGWEISNDGRKIRFNIEDSQNCGGNNSKTQSGSATATIVTPDDYKFIPVVRGHAEMQDSSFEQMLIAINGDYIIKSTSPGGGLGCVMGNLAIIELLPPPYILPPGINTFTITFTTGDGLYQKDAFYELNLFFEEL